MPTIIDKVLRVGEAGQMRRLKRIADQVNSIEEHFTPLSDAELRAMTDQFRERLGEGDTLDELLPEAFAAVREAARRTLGQRHFDVQIMGGAALHGGNIAEMRTGEGKTLVATLACYLNALAGKGVEIAGQGGDEGFAFAGLHFCDLALMENDAADELDVEVAHLDGACSICAISTCS